MKKMSAQQIYDILFEKYGTAKCELDFSSNFELLIAVILSAQCTDKRVNEVTKTLFKKYNTPQDFASLGQTELEKLIYSCGFYHNKAKAIISASKQILSDYDGNVPEQFDELVKLNGVGRKTANVVSSVGFNKDAIAVDTHVFRVSNRLGLSKSTTPLKCEQDLQQQFPKDQWRQLHTMLVMFGRYECKSQRPLCVSCPFQQICLYYKSKASQKKAK